MSDACDRCMKAPNGWTLIEMGLDGAAYRRASLQVIASAAQESDGYEWIHVSATQRFGKNKFALPSWDDLKEIKNAFIGEQRYAYIVFPDSQHYVNIHPHVLHLWARADGANVLPDFTRGGESI